jgi:low affinity Fe/Cu permease
VATEIAEIKSELDAMVEKMRKDMNTSIALQAVEIKHLEAMATAMLKELRRLTGKEIVKDLPESSK